jgi:hypothetical protein
MENINIDWIDAIFGEVPEKDRDWYLKESGTYWNSTKKDWFVRGIQKVDVERRNKKGEMVPVTIYRAEDFQNKMLKMKEYIRNNIFGGTYTITNGNSFDLMRDGETKIEIAIGNEKKLETIMI